MFLNLDLLKPDVSLYVQYILKTDVPSNLMYKLNSKYIHAGPETATQHIICKTYIIQSEQIQWKKILVANIQDHLVKYDNSVYYDEKSK
jgi:hypothetical protein